MSPSYKPGEVAEILGISVDSVRRLTDAGELPTTRSAGGHRLIDGRALAAYLVEHGRPATEAAPAVASTARNRFPGIVTRVLKDRVAAQVEIQAGPHRVVSLLTREAVDELGLEPGVLAVASVKSTNVVVEVPR